MSEEELSQLSLILLNEAHTIKPFDCEDIDLNEFLFEKAKFYKQEFLATTFILENEEQTVAYYSIFNDSLKVEEEGFASKSAFKRFLKDVSIGKSKKVQEIDQNYSLKIGWIPSLIRDNLFRDNDKTFEEVVKEKINSLKEETQKLIENNNKKPEDRDRNIKFSFKKGDLATFVAKDIIYFMESKEEIVNGKKEVSK